MKNDACVGSNSWTKCVLSCCLALLTPGLRADYLTAPPIASGGVLDMTNAPSYTFGPLIAGLDPAKDFSVEGWVYLPPRTKFSGSQYFLFFQEPLTVVEVNQSPDGKNFEIFFGVNTGTAKQYAGDIFSRSWTELENTWHHVACVHDSQKKENRTYLDGQLTVPSSSQTLTFGQRPARLDKALVAGGYEYINYVSGLYWDEIHVAKGTQYTANFIPLRQPILPGINTLALWHFDDGAGATEFEDASGNGYHLQSALGAKTVDLPVVQGPKLGLLHGAGDQLVLQITGEPGRDYRLESTQNLGDWIFFKQIHLTGNAQSMGLTGSNSASFFRAK